MSSWFVTVYPEKICLIPLLTKLSLSEIIQVLMNGTCFFCAGFYCIPLSPQHTDDRWLIDPKTVPTANCPNKHTSTAQGKAGQPLPLLHRGAKICIIPTIAAVRHAKPTYSCGQVWRETGKEIGGKQQQTSYPLKTHQQSIMALLA